MDRTAERDGGVENQAHGHGNRAVSRRQAIETLGRWAMGSILALLGGLLAARSRGVAPPAARCDARSDCLSCPSLTGCPEERALAAMSAAQRSLPVEGTVWQLDPEKCVQCGQCATNCVLTPSAVKCVHTFAICGYCRLCFGYFTPGAKALDEGAENQLCPMGAIRRRFVEEPYYEYAIDETLCVGCGKCVKGCSTFGNGSLHLQVRHDRCVGCNECSIARNCPSDAYRRVPASAPYLFKREARQK